MHEYIVKQGVSQELLLTIALKTTYWKRAQLADSNISQILHYLALGERPLNQMAEESKIDKRFFRDWDKYVIEDGVLLRESVQQGQKVSQLVVPEQFQTDMLRAYYDDLGHQAESYEKTIVLARYGRFCEPNDQRIKKMKCHRDDNKPGWDTLQKHIDLASLYCTQSRFHTRLHRLALLTSTRS